MGFVNLMFKKPYDLFLKKVSIFCKIKKIKVLIEFPKPLIKEVSLSNSLVSLGSLEKGGLSLKKSLSPQGVGGSSLGLARLTLLISSDQGKLDFMEKLFYLVGEKESYKMLGFWGSKRNYSLRVKNIKGLLESVTKKEVRFNQKRLKCKIYFYF